MAARSPSRRSIPLRRRRLPAALLCHVLGTLLVPPALASAQCDQAPAGVTLGLEPVGDGTVTGLAVFTPRDADTAAPTAIRGAALPWGITVPAA
jgi:hypothetical protein